MLCPFISHWGFVSLVSHIQSTNQTTAVMTLLLQSVYKSKRHGKIVEVEAKREEMAWCPGDQGAGLVGPSSGMSG